MSSGRYCATLMTTGRWPLTRIFRTMYEALDWLLSEVRWRYAWAAGDLTGRTSEPVDFVEDLRLHQDWEIFCLKNVEGDLLKHHVHTNAYFTAVLSQWDEA